ncbi:unnamed protein product [Adineta steineri]|uniref:Ubiquitin-like domain-containing protein n=1 Tax=Adineta steineri TaxID=433720 RepID=A0A815B8D1_9BILA|nr:unnamed protein product [Adineta steineri]CAF1265758.1 unnamed protein product [Adineta steineri]CAF1320558.1 unnamed protein product [Adineta steineri]
MAAADVISNIPSSFIYEDLVSQVQAIQYQIIEMENSINNQLQIDKKVRNELKSRSLTFIDPFGNRTTNNYMDHESISKIIRDFKETYVPKYLHQWIRIGTKNDDIISPLDESELKSTVSEYENGQEFVSYGEIPVFIGKYEDFQPQRIVINMLLTDNIEKIKLKIKQRRLRPPADFELKSCIIDPNKKPNISNWKQGTILKSEETIMSSQLYQNNCVVLAKIIRKKIDNGSSRDFQIFVTNITGRIITLTVNSEMNVFEVKKLIQNVTGVSCDYQRFICGGMQPEDEEILSDYGISDKGTIHSVLTLRGGMYHFTSGRQDFHKVPRENVNTIRKVLTFKFKDMNDTQQLSLFELQNSILQAKTVLSILYREIKHIPTTNNIPDLKNIILQLPNDNEDNSDDDENNDLYYDAQDSVP